MNLFKRFFSKKPTPIITYKDFWNWFQQHEKHFHTVVKKEGDIDKFFFNKIGPKLDELREGFWYVTGMSDDETVELRIDKRSTQFTRVEIYRIETQPEHK